MNEKLRKCAEAAYEANRVYNRALGDFSHLAWVDTLPESRKGAMSGVQKVIDGATVEDLHESWMASRKADGWVYGPTKDVDKKTHPCLRPYSEIPLKDRVKDEIFMCVARGTARALGLIS